MRISKHFVSSVSIVCVRDVDVSMCSGKHSLKNDFFGACFQNGAFSTTKNQQIVGVYANLAVN